MKLELTESCHLDPECQRMYMRCVDLKCCWEVLWSSGSNIQLSYCPLSPVVTLRRQLVLPAQGWDTTNVLHLAQHFSVLRHRMLSAYQSDEFHWLQHPQQIGWWTTIECRPGQQIGWIAAVLAVQELSGGSQPHFLHEPAQSSTWSLRRTDKIAISLLVSSVELDVQSLVRPLGPLSSLGLHISLPVSPAPFWTSTTVCSGCSIMRPIHK